MKQPHAITLFIIAACSVLAGCSTGNVVKAGPDTYSVTSSGTGFSTDGVRAKVYKRADNYCTKQGLVMVEKSISTQAGAFGQHPPNADLQFRCLKAGDPEIARRAADVQGVMIGELRDGGSKPSGSNKYTELKQLKELLDTGAVTPAEYDEQKAKLLAR